MKAIVRETYGSPSVLRLDDVPTPIVGDDDVLVRVHAASANAGDWHLLRGTPIPFRLVAGLNTPKYKIIGSDIAGTVEAVGRNVSQFKRGDEVFGEVSRCGFGAYAEYVAARECALALKPTNLSFEEAASVPTSGCTALQGLRKGKIQSGQKVAIHGASGGVGTFAVQIAKALGAEVTGICSTKKVEMIRTIGADHVLDYTLADFVNSNPKFDLILAANGDRSILDYRRTLTPTGRYVMSGGSNRQLCEALLLGPPLSIARQKLGNLLAKPNQSDLMVLKDLIEAGKVRPVIERSYRLSEVPDAIRYLESGHASGKLVVAMPLKYDLSL
ncbi:MAG: NAD(P)-dependent alcohol dehydrogenase [Sphingorhabdus sp.]|uniref:NAD(P)-dependent alcohol dehydrogenase n=1 Tax=Sphingorhabdus sp. TaxID=1902408 RepID=UPI0038FCDBC3